MHAYKSVEHLIAWLVDRHVVGTWRSYLLSILTFLTTSTYKSISSPTNLLFVGRRVVKWADLSLLQAPARLKREVGEKMGRPGGAGAEQVARK
jgi:hypothetical protein